MTRVILLLSFLSISLTGCSRLALESVSPNFLAAGTRAEVVVNGAGFDEDLTLTLRGDAAEIDLGALSVTGPSEARAEIPPAAPPGVYDVVAGDDEALLEGAITLTADEAFLVFIDIGQGDATLVVAPSGEVALIDGGPRGAGVEVRRALNTYGGGRLDVVALSHTDADHLAGLVEVLAGDDGDEGTADDIVPPVVLAPRDDGTCETQTCDRYRALAAAPFRVPLVGEEIALGDVMLEVVAIDGDVGAGPIAGASDANERSLAIMVRYADRSALILGDLTGGGIGTADVEAPLAQSTGPVDILRVAHHGSRTSSNASAVAQWAPAFSVVSVGTDNNFCHPAPDVLERVSTASAQVMMTGVGITELDGCEVTTPELDNVSSGLGDILLRIRGDGEVLSSP